MAKKDLVIGKYGQGFLVVTQVRKLSNFFKLEKKVYGPYQHHDYAEVVQDLLFDKLGEEVKVGLTNIALNVASVEVKGKRVTLLPDGQGPFAWADHKPYTEAEIQL